MSTREIEIDDRADDEQSSIHPYLSPYRQAVAAQGPGFESLLFFSREAQQRRFEVIGSVANLANRNVGDLGCGHADLVVWMSERGIPYTGYVGVEAVEELVGYSRRQLDKQDRTRARCIEADFVADERLFARLVEDYEIDTLIFSGSLNTLPEGQAKSTLDRAWQSIKFRPNGQLVFNFLSQIEGQPDRDTFLPVPRFGAVSMFRWALERTPLVVYCQYYLGGHDGTIAMMTPQ